MNIGNWDDAEIVRRIQDDTYREWALYALFHKLDWRGAAIALIIKIGGLREDAEELAQDALVYFDLNVRRGMYKGESALKTYFLSIVKRRWLKFAQKNRPNIDVFDEKLHDIADNEFDLVEFEEDDLVTFTEALSLVGERCKRIFNLRVLKKSHLEIAVDIGVLDANAAKKEAYRCRLKLRKFLENSPSWKNRLKKLGEHE